MKPILIHLGSIPIRGYGAFVGAALVIGMSIVMRYGRRIGLPQEHLLDATFASVIGGLIGGRLMYVVVHAGDFTHDPLAALKVWEGGMMYFGGLVLGAVVGIVVARRKGLRVWQGMDCIAPAIGSGQALGRIACLVAGCCYGQPVEGHWAGWQHLAITFTDSNAAGPLNVALIPTQILQIVEGLLLWALGAWMFRARKWDGQAFLITFGAAGLSRYLLEGLRGDPARGFFLPSIFGETFSSSRVLGIGMIAATFALYAFRVVTLKRADRAQLARAT